LYLSRKAPNRISSFELKGAKPPPALRGGRRFFYGLLRFKTTKRLSPVRKNRFCQPKNHILTRYIAFRVVQGIGSGSIMPIAFSIIFTLFADPKHAAKLSGVMGAVFGLSSVAGPQSAR
jgi:MFS family permease